MGLNEHLNWQQYRRQVASTVSDYPDVAVAIVERNFPALYEMAEEYHFEELLLRIHYDMATADIREGSAYTSHEFEYWDDEEVTIFESIRDNLEPVVQVLVDLEEEGHEVEWVYPSDVKTAMGTKKQGIKPRIESHNEKNTGNRNIITFPSFTAALVWLDELRGQISDGAWENHEWRRGTWEDYCNATIKVDTDSTKVTWDGRSVDDLEFHDVVEGSKGMRGRMLYLVRASEIDEDYTEDNLMEDIRRIDEMDYL